MTKTTEGLVRPREHPQPQPTSQHLTSLHNGGPGMPPLHSPQRDFITAINHLQNILLAYKYAARVRNPRGQTLARSSILPSGQVNLRFVVFVVVRKRGEPCVYVSSVTS